MAAQQLGQSAQKGQSAMPNLLFRALPVVQLPSNKELMTADDFELVQLADVACPLSEVLAWYWKIVGDLTLVNQKEMEGKRYQIDNGELISIADISKALARAVGDLWNYKLRNVLSAVTYVQPPNDVVRFRIELATEPSGWTYAIFYQIETFVKFKCDVRDGTKKILVVNLKTPSLSTKAMIAQLVNAFVARDLQTLDFLKAQPGSIAWKQVIIPLTCIPVPARPDEQHSGIFLSQRQGLTVWHELHTAPLTAEAEG